MTERTHHACESHTHPSVAHAEHTARVHSSAIERVRTRAHPVALHPVALHLHSALHETRRHREYLGRRWCWCWCCRCWWWGGRRRRRQLQLQVTRTVLLVEALVAFRVHSGADPHWDNTERKNVDERGCRSNKHLWCPDAAALAPRCHAVLTRWWWHGDRECICV